MTDVFEQGGSAVLVAEWFEYPGGPAIDATGVTITITPTGGGSAAVGPTSTDIIHLATGVDSYSWAVPDDLATGEYLVAWNGTIGSGDAQATEVIRVRLAGLWPPVLTELKDDAGIDQGDMRDDDRLQVMLDAAVVFVERVKGSRYNFTGDTESDLPAPTEDIRLGTMRLAYRWHVRRRSPDGLIQMAELGATRVPGFDPDIERQLQIGRYTPMAFA
jgi:hypothetical protein